MKRTLRPDRLLREVLGVGWARKNILGRDYSLKNEVKRAILKADVMTERQLDSMADKVTDFYISKAERLQAEGIKSYRKEAINNERLMKERVEMAVTYYEVDREVKAHAGGFYRWLPSEAKEPEPEHALLYGKIFKVGEGDKDGNMPMQRYGCRCGIEWLSDETAEKELTENKAVEAEEEKEVKNEKILRFIQKTDFEEQGDDLIFYAICRNGKVRVFIPKNEILQEKEKMIALDKNVIEDYTLKAWAGQVSRVGDLLFVKGFRNLNLR